MHRSQYNVKVRNDHHLTIEDRYDGILYVMPANKEVSIPYDAACHIFGVQFAEQGIDRDAIFRHLQKRWGWNRTDTEHQALKRFRALSFSLVAVSIVESPVEEDLAEPRPGAPKEEAKAHTSAASEAQAEEHSDEGDDVDGEEKADGAEEEADSAPPVPQYVRGRKRRLTPRVAPQEAAGEVA